MEFNILQFTIYHTLPQLVKQNVQKLGLSKFDRSGGFYTRICTMNFSYESHTRYGCLCTMKTPSIDGCSIDKQTLKETKAGMYMTKMQ